MEGDELYTVKNNFWLGNFTDALAEAKAARVRSDAVRVERDVYVYRSLIGVGRARQVLDEITPSSSLPSALAAVRALAAYECARGRGESSGLELTVGGCVCVCEDMLADAPSDASAPLARVVLATVFLNESAYENALRCVSVPGPASLEALSVRAHVHMCVDRHDLAEADVKAMQSIDDECALTLLTLAALHARVGGERYKEASIVYRDLLDRFGPCLPGLLGLGCVYVCVRRWEDADRALRTALERAAATGNERAEADVIVNLLAVMAHTGRWAEAESTLLPRLREVSPHTHTHTHPYVAAMDTATRAFERVAASFKV